MKQVLKVKKASFAVVAAVLLLSGCSSSSSTGMGEMDDMQHSNNDSKSDEKASSTNFSSNDLMFADMMIPHHQQAVEMSELALKNSTNPDIISLAEKIKAAQAPEIDQMQRWKDSDSSADHGMMDHSDHGMMGMLSDEEFAALQKSTGATFDKLFLDGMIKHHEGAIDMAEMIDESKNEEVQALREAIIKSQRAEIEEMKTLLASLN
jgi:uncharacterized protein (DUF305 family)